jgi:hypothetical protein
VVITSSLRPLNRLRILLVDEHSPSEIDTNPQLNAEQTFALGQATLKAAFSTGAAHISEGGALLAEAFRLRNKSCELAYYEQQLIKE